MFHECADEIKAMEHRVSFLLYRLEQTLASYSVNVSESSSLTFVKEVRRFLGLNRSQVDKTKALN